MNTPFKINRVVAEIDYEKIDEKYDFFEIKTSEKYFDTGARILDDLILNGSVRSVQFDLGRKFYVMMLHDELNEGKIKNVLLSSEKAETLSFEKTDSRGMYKNQLVQLFLNGLYRSEHKKLRYNNLAGHLYCFHPNWLIHKRGDANTIWTVPCLDVKITWLGNLTLEIKTFTAVQALLSKRSEEEKGKILKLPRYTLEANNTMRRSLKEDDGKLQYVMRTFENTKTSKNFMNLSPANKYIESKIGMLAEITSKLDQEYGDLLQLDFAKIDNYQSEEFTTKIGHENDSYIEKALEEKPIKVIDEINDEYSSEECQKILALVKERFPKVQISIGKNFSKNSLNISLLHNEKFYIEHGLPDPYKNKHEGCTVQHITVEDAMECLDAAINNVLHNVLIKEDLKKKHISLFNWSKIGLNENISFGVADPVDKKENVYNYIFMDISPDGSFEISELQHDLFNQNQYSKCVEIFDRAHSEKRNRIEPVKGIVRDAQGNFNVIRDTEIITLPEFLKIKEMFDSGNDKVRRVEYLNTYFSACTNIKMFEDNGKNYYCVGIKKSNFPRAVPRAVNVREIETFDGAPNLFDKLLPLMTVEFVRNGQLTVLPFPFKYLREWVDMNKEKLNSNRN